MRTIPRSYAVRLAVGLAAAVSVASCGDDDDTASTSETATETSLVAASTGPADTIASFDTSAAVETTAVSAEGGAVTTAAAEGTTFTSAEGDYSVVFPAEPSVQTQQQPLPDGSNVELVLAGYEFDDGFIATARGQYPDGYVLDPPVALQGAQDQALEQVDGTLITSTDITLQGRPGKEFSATITNGGETGTLLQRVYLDGLVIYQQVFTGAGEASFTDPEVATFFDSFAFATG
jgi:hypothetical protein